MYLENKRYQSCDLAGRQKGFVLVLALVLLAVMTLIGVSSMSGANMELKATANAQQHQVAFNAVQSVLEYAISDQGANPIVDYQTSNTALTQIVTTTVTKASALSAKVVLMGCSVGIGSSLEDGKGFRYNFFNITGSGSNSTGTATSIQQQGVRYPSAAC